MIKVSFEEEYIYLTCVGGKISARILSDDSIEYELDGHDEEYKEKFMEEIGQAQSILLIENIHVDEECRGEGLAGKLLEKLFEIAKDQCLTCLYLNASPILAEDGLDLESLTAFYERRGFNPLLNQDTNVLMLKKI